MRIQRHRIQIEQLNKHRPLMAPSFLRPHLTFLRPLRRCPLPSSFTFVDGCRRFLIYIRLCVCFVLYVWGNHRALWVSQSVSRPLCPLIISRYCALRLPIKLASNGTSIARPLHERRRGPDEWNGRWREELFYYQMQERENRKQSDRVWLVAIGLYLTGYQRKSYVYHCFFAGSIITITTKDDDDDVSRVGRSVDGGIKGNVAIAFLFYCLLTLYRDKAAVTVDLWLQKKGNH